MKNFVIVVLLLGLAASVGWQMQAHPAHRYQLEPVKDVAGNNVFLRIDLDTGTECAIGHGWAVVRHSELDPDPYRVPFCEVLQPKGN